jgi:uncharacterized membrane protein YeiH
VLVEWANDPRRRYHLWNFGLISLTVGGIIGGIISKDGLGKMLPMILAMHLPTLICFISAFSSLSVYYAIAEQFDTVLLACLYDVFDLCG